jgi:hypothetical protein
MDVLTSSGSFHMNKRSPFFIIFLNERNTKADMRIEPDDEENFIIE